MIYLDLPSPFGLAKLTELWCRPIALYDPDLVIFPSQKHAHYRLARTCLHGSVRDVAQYKKLAGGLTDDLKIMLSRNLVAVPFALPPDIGKLDPMNVVRLLMRRDQWRYGGRDADGSKAADALEAKEKAEQKAIDDPYLDEMRRRKKAAGISYLYRTGARVSLVSPRRKEPAPESSTQTGPDGPAGCST